LYLINAKTLKKKIHGRVFDSVLCTLYSGVKCYIKYRFARRRRWHIADWQVRC